MCCVRRATSKCEHHNEKFWGFFSLGVLGLGCPFYTVGTGTQRSCVSIQFLERISHPNPGTPNP